MNSDDSLMMLGSKQIKCYFISTDFLSAKNDNLKQPNEMRINDHTLHALIH